MNEKIKDKAQITLAKKLAEFDNRPFDELKPQATNFTDGNTQSTYLRRARELFVSGETDEVCPKCRGKRKVYRMELSEADSGFVKCSKCNGTGHKLWHIEIVEG